MSKLPIPSPDFDSIKQSLKDFLKQQDELTDYDFDGSVISGIVDLLAYNTHINSFYLNMIANESFLSTAVKRDSVVQKAAQLGYTPKSISAASAIVDVTLYSNSNDPFILLPADTVFTAKDDQNTYTFRTYDSFSAQNMGNGSFLAKDVKIYEGKLLTYRFVIDSLEKIQNNQYVIPNPNVDTSILRVYVSQQAGSGSFEEYVLSKNIVDNGPNSLVYYLEETEGGLYKISFGDNQISKSVLPGQIVKIDYFVTVGPVANGIRKFELQTTFPNVTSHSIITTAGAAGGTPAESISSIKFNAPRNFSIQNRAVTANDFQHIVKLLYNNAEDVIAKGGEQLVPPLYNKIALYIKPKTGFYMSDADKRNLVPVIKKYSTILTEPVILDPEYLHVNVFTNIDYNPLATASREDELKRNIFLKIKDFSQLFLSKFEKDLRYSNLISYINTTDAAVISNITNLQVEKRIFVSTSSKRDYEFQFSTRVRPGTFFSSGFSTFEFTNCYFQDNGFGVIKIFSTDQGNTVTVSENAGSIEYEKGSVYISPLVVKQLSETDEFFDQDVSDYFVKFKCSTNNEDINRANDQIILINEVNITLSKG